MSDQVLFNTVKSNLDYLDWQTKRGIVRTLIKQINIGLDKVEVAFRIKELAQNGGILNLYHCTTHHDKGAGGVCQVVFVALIVFASHAGSCYSNNSYARDLITSKLTMDH